MRIALVQMKNEGNIRRNLNKSIHYIQEASENNANLILFPEVQLSEFFPQYEGRDVSQYRLDILSEEVKAFQKESKENSDNSNLWSHRLPDSQERNLSLEYTFQICNLNYYS